MPRVERLWPYTTHDHRTYIHIGIVLTGKKVYWLKAGMPKYLVHSNYRDEPKFLMDNNFQIFTACIAVKLWKYKISRIGIAFYIFLLYIFVLEFDEQNPIKTLFKKGFSHSILFNFTNLFLTHNFIYFYKCVFHTRFCWFLTNVFLHSFLLIFTEGFFTLDFAYSILLMFTNVILILDFAYSLSWARLKVLWMTI